jgi:predicted anti-sigma-YlaC factor YlaD
MNNHAIHWLGAYLDGELRGLRLHWVESHLKECAICREELNSLARLRILLQESPAPERFTQPERFVAQVGLRLPRRQEQPPARKALELAWRLVPVGLLFTLVFAQTVFMIAGVLRVALWLGVGGDLGSYLFSTAAGAPSVPDLATLSQASLAESVASLWALVQSGGTWASLPLLYLGLMAVIGLLYWSWLASWWARRRHQRLLASE